MRDTIEDGIAGFPHRAIGGLGAVEHVEEAGVVPGAPREQPHRDRHAAEHGEDHVTRRVA